MLNCSGPCRDESGRPRGVFPGGACKKTKRRGRGPVVGQAAWASVAIAMHGRIGVVSFLRYARSGKTEERRGRPGTHLRAAEGTDGSWAVWQRGGAASGRPGGVSLLHAMHTNGGSPSGAGGSVRTGRPRRRRRLKMGWLGRRRGSTWSRGPSSSSMISSMPQQALLLLGAPFGWSTPVAATGETGQHGKVR
jgi:hypothetical protein